MIMAYGFIDEEKYQTITMTFACGCTYERTYFGRLDERSRRQHEDSQKDCFKCNAAKESEKAARLAVSLGYPALQGSENQVAWAENIRRDMIDDAANEPGDFSDLVEYLETQTSAKWFIENRDKTAKVLDNEFVQ